MTCEISLSDDSDLYFQLAGIDRADCTWNGHAITSMDTDAIESAIASRIHSFLVTEDENSGAYLRAIVNLACRGSQGSTQQSLVERDIAELLNTPEGLLACGKDGVILPAGICKSTWKFCQKHSKAILIGVAVVAVVAAVVIVAAATGGAGAGAAAPAAGALGAMLGATGNDSMNHSPQDPRSNTHGQNSMSVESQSGLGNTIENRRSLADNLEGKSMGEQEPWTPSLIPSTPFRQPFESSWPASPPVNYNSFTPKDPFGFLSEVSPLLHPIPQQPDSTNRSIPFVLDPEYGVKFFADSPCSNDSIAEKLKNFGAVLAHEALDGVSQVTSCVPQFLEEIKDIGNRVMPESFFVSEDPNFFGSPNTNYANLIATGHEKIDQAFGTNQSGHYTAEAKENRDHFSIGIIPPPGQLFKELSVVEKTLVFESIIGLKNGATVAEVTKLEMQLSNWLGEGTRLIRNEANDLVFLSKDGFRCVRFDFNKTNPHNNPHAHVEIKVNGKWTKSGPIYPTDVPHN
jgi:hypothetical protein